MASFGDNTAITTGTAVVVASMSVVVVLKACGGRGGRDENPIALESVRCNMESKLLYVGIPESVSSPELDVAVEP